MQKSLNLQEVFLNQVRRSKTFVTVFLVNGFQIRGIVTGFDSFTVVLDSDGRQQLVYKHAISTIQPSRAVDFMEGVAE
jgi:host factor-I protein